MDLYSSILDGVGWFLWSFFLGAFGFWLFAYFVVQALLYVFRGPTPQLRSVGTSILNTPPLQTSENSRRAA